MSSIKVEIGKKEYNLTGDEELIRQSADELNSTIGEIEQHMGTMSNETLLVLAALNISEQKKIDAKKNENNLSHITVEINKMVEFLDSAFEQED